MNLQKNGVTIAIDDAVIVEMVLKQLAGEPSAVVCCTSEPKIGEPWQGGIYAGLSIENECSVRLVLLSGDTESNWKGATAWAEQQGGVLPSRIDQLVLFKNLKAQFRGEAYWSSEPSAGDGGCAWCAYFYDGYQDVYRKANELRARAVRRLAI